MVEILCNIATTVQESNLIDVITKTFVPTLRFLSHFVIGVFNRSISDVLSYKYIAKTNQAWD